MEGKITSDIEKLTLLGNSSPMAFDVPDALILETFESPASCNRDPSQVFRIRFECPEYTSLCPKTGQPDFATIGIEYVPYGLCVETKSLKLYLGAWRNVRAFMEYAVHKMRDDLVAVLDPCQLTVDASFSPRGGISTTVSAAYYKAG